MVVVVVVVDVGVFVFVFVFVFAAVGEVVEVMFSDTCKKKRLK